MLCHATTGEVKQGSNRNGPRCVSCKEHPDGELMTRSPDMDVQVLVQGPLESREPSRQSGRIRGCEGPSYGRARVRFCSVGSLLLQRPGAFAFHLILDLLPELQRIRDAVELFRRSSGAPEDDGAVPQHPT